MNLLVATEYHFNQDGSGCIRSENGTRAYEFWSRYLEVFSSVTVIARVSQTPDAVGEPVEGGGVSVAAIPAYSGPLQYALRLRRIKQRVRDICDCDAAIILRIPGAISNLVFSEVHRYSRPFGLEVVGDPFDVFSAGSVKHPLRRWFQWSFVRQQRMQCAVAVGAAYVNTTTLPSRYPCPGMSTHYSSVVLNQEHIGCSPKVFHDDLSKRPVRLITVGSLAQTYKGTDILVEAVHRLQKANVNVELTVVGDGRHKRQLESQAISLGVDRSVKFLGKLSAGDAVRQELDRSDIFVLPSRTEGLPRAMIEAMSRGLPCVGTRVGGIPELLSDEDLVPPEDSVALAAKLHEVWQDGQRLSTMASRNLHKACEYREDVLRERRIAFYRHLCARTDEWLSGVEHRRSTAEAGSA